MIELGAPRPFGTGEAAGRPLSRRWALIRSGFAAAALGLLALFAFTNASAQEDAAEVEKRLTEEESRAFGTFIEKAAESRREHIERKVDRAIEAVVKSVELDENAREALMGEKARILEATQAVWKERFREWLTPHLLQSGNPSSMLQQWNPADLASNQQEVAAPPEKTKEWKEALERILTPEQTETLATQEEARLARLREELSDYLEACAAQATESLRPLMDDELGEIRQLGGFDDERKQKLEAAAAEALKATVQTWRDRSEQRLMEMEEEQRAAMTSHGGIMGVSISDPDSQPNKNPVWLNALTEHLTEEERAAIAQRRADNRARRSEALAMVFIDSADRFLGLSKAQRFELMGMVKELMLGLPEHYYTSLGRGYYSVDPGQMLREAAKADEEGLRKVLDERQMERWKALKAEDLARHRTYAAVQNDLEGKEAPVPEDTDAGSADQQLSAYLHRRATAIRESRRLVMEAKVDRVNRAVRVSPATTAMLTTAAKGAAEEMAQQAISSIEEWIRRELRGVPPKGVPAKLRSLQGPYFSDRDQDENPELWTKTLARVLSGEERAVFEAEEAAAKDWRLQSQVMIVTTEVERSVALSAEKRERLMERLGKVIDEYQQDLAEMLSPWWHCEGYYMTMPLALVQEEELKEIFDPAQLEMLRTRGPGEVEQVADQIRKVRESRTKP